MKSLYLTFEEKDFDKLQKAKERSGLKWESYFLELMKHEQIVYRFFQQVCIHQEFEGEYGSNIHLDGWQSSYIVLYRMKAQNVGIRPMTLESRRGDN